MEQTTQRPKWKLWQALLVLFSAAGTVVVIAVVAIAVLAGLLGVFAGVLYNAFNLIATF